MAVEVSSNHISNQLSTNSVRVAESSYLLSSSGNGVAGKKTNTPGRKEKFKRRYLNWFFTGQWPVLYVLTLAVIVNFLNVAATKESKFRHLIDKANIAGQGANAGVLLLYPFLGWLAETYITYYKAIGCALYLSIVGMTMGFGISIAGFSSTNLGSDNNLIIYLALLPLLLSFLGNAFFNANAIQLGTDQMLEASSEQLSSFVYWYFWMTQIGDVIVYIIIIIITEIPFHHHKDPYFIVAVLTLIQVMLLVIGIVIFHTSKRHLYIQPTRRNTIKNIFKVLLYAKKHKYPQRRSALTYWENTSPSRIDLGKEKYGGPFKAEEVEDTKSFLRILILLISLFGLYTVDSAKSLTNFVLKEYNVTDNTDDSTNTTVILEPLKILITNDSRFISQLVIVLSIPLLQLVIKPTLNNYYPGMLKRFGIGLLCALLSSVTSLIIAFIANSHNGDTDRCKINGLNEHKLDNINTVLPLLLAPQILFGLAKLFIFLTGLEFILAQAPRKMQGLLIGIWYMIGLIKSVLSIIDDLADTEMQCDLHLSSAVLTVVSVIFYAVIVFFYKYRNRGDIVDGYNLVADKVAGRIRRREQYRQEWTTSGLTVDSVSSQRTSINSSTTLQETEDFTHVY